MPHPTGRGVFFKVSSLHPTVTLSLWLFLVLLAQGLPLPILAIASLVGFARCSPAAKSQFVHLLKRSRWILLVLLATFLIFTPGERLWSDFPVSKEGLQSGLEHGLRLISVLLAVGWLAGGRTDDWLIVALWGLLGRWHGEYRRTLIVRLALTLRYSAGQAPRESWEDILNDVNSSSAAGVFHEIELDDVHMTTLQSWTSFGLLVAGGISLWWLA